MSLRIYNTLSRALDDFSPLEPGHVRMYVCGMTIYDLCHMGHARMMMAFDVVQRWLKASGYSVTYVRNITDIDDKIIKRALERGITIRQLTDEMIAAMHRGHRRRWASSRPRYEPRATEYVPQMLRPDRQARKQGPGLPGRQWRRELLPCASSRATASSRASRWTSCAPASAWRCDDGKQDPLDFVLWKAAKPEEPAEAKWASAFGAGPPGLAYRVLGHELRQLLGETFDIHGGGADLQFPHHENEIAQSEGATGKLAWPSSGCTTASCAWTTRRCPRAWATSSPSARCSSRYDAETTRSSSCAPITAAHSITAMPTWTMRARPSSACTRR